MTGEKTAPTLEETRAAVEREMSKREDATIQSKEELQTVRASYVHACGCELEAWLKKRGLVLKGFLRDTVDEDVEIGLTLPADSDCGMRAEMMTL